ncbi:hypothetical protein [Leucobacter muris]|uniref:hypothetical protein n=1 Tax=Leucobacter muris TaxID=1935379 RepID=UPI0013E2B536|nr:hypothetical protein [Leucobacter muris]
MGNTDRNWLILLDLPAPCPCHGKDYDENNKFNCDLYVIHSSATHLVHSDEQNAGNELHPCAGELEEADGRSLERGEPSAQECGCAENVQEDE